MCIATDIEAHLGDEYWLTNFHAELNNDVWEVWQTLPEMTLGGGLGMLIARDDGHLVDVVITQ